LRPRPKRGSAGKPRSSKAEEEILALVRTGVERFILNDATIEDFLTTIRDVADKGKTHPHQLTRSAFSKIVKEAIRKRNLRRSK
jgi:DNA-binding NarL/FixJ family response regulator